MSFEDAVEECTTGRQRKSLLGMLRVYDTRPVDRFLCRSGYKTATIQCAAGLYGCYYLDAVKVVADAPTEESGQ